MPEHFLALVKQYANLASNADAERSAKAVINSLDATIDAQLMGYITPALPEYLQPAHKHFFARKNTTVRQFNQQIYFERLKLSLSLTDTTEATTRFAAVMEALAIVQPKSQRRLAKYLPIDLLAYWKE
jgi:uncharacterized protein (DUF2267 family)